MEQTDTEKLLRECDAGTKMAVTSIDEVIDKVTNSNMKSLLEETKDHHSKLGNEIHSLLNSHNTAEKDPSPIAKSMSWMKTNINVGIDKSDETVADILTDGCNMGVKSLNRYLNQYKAADSQSKKLCTKLISIEEQFCKELSQYL